MSSNEMITNQTIDYSKLDPGVINLVKYFNEVGLKTSMSCQGHGITNMSVFWIEFSKSITESDIVDFMSKHSHMWIKHDKTVGKCFVSNGHFYKRLMLKGHDHDVPYYRWTYVVGTVEAANQDCELWKQMDQGVVFWNGPSAPSKVVEK